MKNLTDYNVMLQRSASCPYEVVVAGTRHEDMNTLNLNRVRHKEDKQLVKVFLASNDPPMRIITGNSPPMQNIVKKLLNVELKWQYESDWNLGALIILKLG